MKHSIREHIIDPVRGKIVKISTINAELGSGILDCNGNEIFEGDIIKFYDGDIETVTFEDGTFYVGDLLLSDFARNIEVVGHVED